MGCEVELWVCIATPEEWQRCLWSWRWLEPDSGPWFSLFSLLPLISGGFLDSGTMTKGNFSLTSLQPHDQRGKRGFLPFPIGKDPREALWLAQFGSCAFPWANDCGQGNGMLWLARVWVTCSSFWSGGEGAMREVCCSGKLSQLPLVCFQLAEALCCLPEPWVCL